MKVEAGAWSPARDQLEQVYVLEGTFYDEEKEYRKGGFMIIAPGAMRTAGSRNGVLLW